MQDELNDIVNKTCRGVAACRAVELLKNSNHAIVRDELSIHLAGPAYIERIRKRWEESVQRSGCDPNTSQHLYFAARARILDDMLLAALQQLSTEQLQLPSSTPASNLTGTSIRQPFVNGGDCNSNSQPATHQQQQQQQQDGVIQLQVVCVGCGVDTRPWRLTFPPGVAWYDVDQQPVISLKARLLREAGAQLQGELQQQPVEHSQPTLGGCPQQQQQQQQQAESSGGVYKYPLCCSRYAALAADVTQSSWVAQLEAAGFQPGLPTVWVVEGLLYYLSPEQGQRLLQDMAAASTPRQGVVIATHIPLCNLAANRTAPPSYPLSGLFKSYVGDFVDSARSSSCWEPVEVSADLFVLLQEQYGVNALYPYAEEYSGGVPLKEIECVVTLKRHTPACTMHACS